MKSSPFVVTAASARLSGGPGCGYFLYHLNGETPGPCRERNPEGAGGRMHSGLWEMLDLAECKWSAAQARRARLLVETADNPETLRWVAARFQLQDRFEVFPGGQGLLARAIDHLQSDPDALLLLWACTPEGGAGLILEDPGAAARRNAPVCLHARFHEATPLPIEAARRAGCLLVQDNLPKDWWRTTSAALPLSKREIPGCAVSLTPGDQPSLFSLLRLVLAVRHAIQPSFQGASKDGSPTLDSATRLAVFAKMIPWFPSHGGLERSGLLGLNLSPRGEGDWVEMESDQPPEPILDYAPSELIVFSGETPEEILKRGRGLITETRSTTATLAALACRLALSAQEKPVRLSLTASTLPELRERLEKALDRLENKGEARFHIRQHTFYAATPTGQETDQLVLLFPGQGSQAFHMGRQLHFHEPVLRETFDQWNRSQAGEETWPVAAFLFPPANLSDELAGRAQRNLWNVAVGGQAAFLQSLKSADLLRNIGFECQAMLGYSNGENVGLFASGLLQDPDGQSVLNVMSRLRVDDPTVGQRVPKGVMLAVTLRDHTALQSILEKFNGHLFLALDNCPNQQVLFCVPGILDEVTAALQEAGAVTLRLPFDRPFHTPLFREKARELRAFYDAFEAGTARVPLFSCSTTHPFPSEPEAIRDQAADLWHLPVRFRETVDQMFQQGFRYFIEAGPSSKLTGYVADNLRGRPHLAMSLNSENRSEMERFYALLGALFVERRWQDPARLYEKRRINPAPDPVLSSAPPPHSLPTDALPAAPRSPTGKPDPLAAAQVGVMHFQLMQEFLEQQQRLLRWFQEAEPSGHSPVPAAAPLLFALQWRDGILQGRCRLDPEENPFLADHPFGSRPSPNRPGLGSLMVVPFTYSMEIAAEAIALATGWQDCPVLEEIRGNRWLTVHESRDFEVEARLEDGVASARIHAREGDPQPLFEIRRAMPGTNEAPSAWSPLPPMQRELFLDVADLYNLVLFHGPSMRVFRELKSIGPGGVDAWFEMPDPGYRKGSPGLPSQTPANLVDAFGHTVAYWFVEELREQSFGIFPYRIGRYWQSRQPMTAGERFLCQARMERTSTGARADLQLLREDGSVCIQAENWEMRFFRYPESFQKAFSSLDPALVFCREEVWEETALHFLETTQFETLLEGVGVWLESLAWTLLGSQERSVWLGLKTPLPRRLQWLCGRIAAKEAVRQWIENRGGPVLWPADVEILPDENGAPRVVCPEISDPPIVSITHSGPVCIAAIHRSGGAVGIDFESTEKTPSDGALRRIFSEAETRLLSNQRPLLEEGWSVKEACSKVFGKGLAGNPKAWRVESHREGVWQVANESKHFIAWTRRHPGGVLALARPDRV